MPKISCWFYDSNLPRVIPTLSLIIMVACQNPATQPYSKVASGLPSPFLGIWVSHDSDAQTSFKLFINQSNDTIWGNYCLVKGGGASCDCPDSVQQKQQPSFVSVANSQEPNLLETAISSYQKRYFGRLRLQIHDETLYWSVVEAPVPGDFPIKQTTFYRDTSFRNSQPKVVL